MQINTSAQKQKGQALLFVVIAMTIALSLGISVSTRTLTSLKRTATTDTSARALSAAEGGIEWFLVQPLQVMTDLAAGQYNKCPTGSTQDASGVGCVLTFQPQTNDTRGVDLIQSIATVTVTTFQYNDPINNGYWFNLETGAVKEVALKSYTSNTYFNGTLNICWIKTDATQSSAIYYLTFNSNGNIEKRLLMPKTIVGQPMSTSGTTLAAGSRTGYPDCYTTGTLNNLVGIRFKTLYGPSKVAIFPTGSNFPTQGFKITSKGQIGNGAESVTVVKTVKAFRSLPYLPASFDYAIYSNGAVD